MEEIKTKLSHLGSEIKVLKERLKSFITHRSIWVSTIAIIGVLATFNYFLLQEERRSLQREFSLEAEKLRLELTATQKKQTQLLQRLGSNVSEIKLNIASLEGPSKTPWSHDAIAGWASQGMWVDPYNSTIASVSDLKAYSETLKAAYKTAEGKGAIVSKSLTLYVKNDDGSYSTLQDYLKR